MTNVVTLTDASVTYWLAVNDEDSELRRALGDIAVRYDSGEITAVAAVIERADRFEIHLNNCRAHRRRYLGGPR